jgi:hypothetical protein
MENYFIFEMLKKKNFAQFSKNLLPKNLSVSSKKYGFGIRDPRSGINLFRIPDPGSGVKKATEPGSPIRISNTEKCVTFKT